MPDTGVVIHLPNLRREVRSLANCFIANPAVAGELSSLAFDLVVQHLAEQGYTVKEG